VNVVVTPPTMSTFPVDNRIEGDLDLAVLLFDDGVHDPSMYAFALLLVETKKQSINTKKDYRIDSL